MHLNLARKWRSRHFDEIVGQPLVIRLVKNSLYRNLLFPVYLLSGTRGCGKTSVARIFAAALNCDALERFQKDPQIQVPCLECASCTAMQAMKHPDFIEIDAASHTGVDNVRAIIDAASFVPVYGKKKIYLIDEAHMLSKAAFNAFLKILEEPPASVVFMLATTDPHKILETVTSRCFQLFFNPIGMEQVVHHLAHICAQENITAEKEALMLIAQETEGSMRDALNVVERIRIAYPSLSSTAVIELLGKIDDQRLGDLLAVVIQGNATAILTEMQKLELTRYNPQRIWKCFVELIRQTLWIKQGFSEHSIVSEKLRTIAHQTSLDRLIQLFEICYDYELSFAKTALPEHMLEMMLLKMAIADKSTPGQKATERADGGSHLTFREGAGHTSPRLSRPEGENSPEISSSSHFEMTAEISPHSQTPRAEAENGSIWEQCLQHIEKINDPLVVSIFKQGMIEKHDSSTKTLYISFSQDLLFFKEWLENTHKIWQPVLEHFYGEGIQLNPSFTGAPKERIFKIPQPPKLSSDAAKSIAAPKKEMNRERAPNTQKVAPERIIKINDPEKWQKAHALISIFPGTLSVSKAPEGESA